MSDAAVARPATSRPDAPSVAAAASPRTSQLATLAVVVVVVAALYLGRDVLVPITLAVLLSFVLAPLVDLLRRVAGRLVSVLMAVLLALGIIVALGGVIGMQVASLADDLPRYATTVTEKIERARGLTLGRLSQMIGRVGDQVRQSAETTAATETERASGAARAPSVAAPSRAPTVTAPGEERPTPVLVQQPNPTPLEVAQRILSPIAAPLATTGVVFIVAIFILLERASLRDRMIRLFGARDLHRTTAAMDDAAHRLSRYFLSQLAVNAAFGVVIAGGLLAIGVPSPGLWGIVAALMRFVPYVGSFVAAAAPIALAAAVDPGWSMMAWTVALFVVCEGLMGQAIEPILYGHSTGLAPISIVIAAIFWTWLWGPIGLILSTPLTLCLVVLGRHVERLEFIDVLLGDRPALTPIESFYQRMLAGDPHEAEGQADQMLREATLTEYYDQVAVPGLRLAAIDAARGVMDAAQLERVHAAVREVIDSLHDHEDPVARRLAPIAADSLSPAWRPDARPVLCVTGRGALDEAACLMLGQLLERRGLGSRSVPFSSVSRSGIAMLDTTGARIACVVQLDIAGTALPRYVVRRLRARLPGVSIVVGLGALAGGATAIASIGADTQVQSLAEAVDACAVAALAAAEEEELEPAAA